MRYSPLVAVLVVLATPVASFAQDCHYGTGLLLVTAQSTRFIDLRGSEATSELWETVGPRLLRVCDIVRLQNTEDQPDPHGAAIEVRSPERTLQRVYVAESIREICAALPDCHDATEP